MKTYRIHLQCAGTFVCEKIIIANNMSNAIHEFAHWITNEKKYENFYNCEIRVCECNAFIVQ